MEIVKVVPHRVLRDASHSGQDHNDPVHNVRRQAEITRPSIATVGKQA
jgi:hypothetical protein